MVLPLRWQIAATTGCQKIERSDTSNKSGPILQTSIRGPRKHHLLFIFNFLKHNPSHFFGMAVMPLLCRGFAKKSCKSHTENAKLGRKCPEKRKNTKNLGGKEKKFQQEIH